MRIYDYAKKRVLDTVDVPEHCRVAGELFILSRVQEISCLRDTFGFDESTALDCADLDESVRYTSFDGYDFISIVHIEINNHGFTSHEINMYVSSRYLVLVLPEHDSPRLEQMEKTLNNYAKLVGERGERINRLYIAILNALLSDFSETLEKLEDWMQALSEDIIARVDKPQFTRLNELRGMAYTLKKQLRAFSYLGDQIALDENKFIFKKQMHQFRNIATRLKKLYDFAESLYSLSSEMLYTYDSRLTMKTNDTVNKLTAVTLFFGPLTVITGIYGMNFDIMPELHWTIGYPFALFLMSLVSLVMFFILKKNKWL